MGRLYQGNLEYDMVVAQKQTHFDLANKFLINKKHMVKKLL